MEKTTVRFIAMTYGDRDGAGNLFTKEACREAGEQAKKEGKILDYELVDCGPDKGHLYVTKEVIL